MTTGRINQVTIVRPKATERERSGSRYLGRALRCGWAGAAGHAVYLPLLDSPGHVRRALARWRVRDLGDPGGGLTAT
jgi:hypothetical protein